MKIQIPIKGGNYTYILDNLSQNYIETIELKYKILQNKFSNKDKYNLTDNDKIFYINYLFSIFEYLNYCNCPFESGLNKDLKLLVHHLEDCYYNDNLEYNKIRILKQLNIENLLKDSLLFLLRQFNHSDLLNTEEYYKNLTISEIKVKLIYHLELIKDKEILSDISSYKYPGFDNYETEIKKIQEKYNINYIDNISINNTDIIVKLDILIKYLIDLNNIYKTYIIELEKYIANIINEFYKLKL